MVSGKKGVLFVCGRMLIISYSEKVDSLPNSRWCSIQVFNHNVKSTFFFCFFFCFCFCFRDWPCVSTYQLGPIYPLSLSPLKLLIFLSIWEPCPQWVISSWRWATRDKGGGMWLKGSSLKDYPEEIKTFFFYLLTFWTNLI